MSQNSEPLSSALRSTLRTTLWAGLSGLAVLLAAGPVPAQERTEKPPLHGQEWMAITGKPLGATAGAKIFERGGNAVDAACAMIAATATMWDTLHWAAKHRR